MSRYFVGAATASYRVLEDRPELAGELERARELFAGLGYQIVQGFGLDPQRERFGATLRAFLTDPARRDTDIVVVYYTGHGVEARGDVLLPMADATADVSFSAQRASDLTRLLEGSPVQQVLFVLDTCHAASATGAITAGVVSYLDSLRARTRGASLAMLVSTRPYEQAVPGAFTKALADAVHHRASGGHEPEYLPLDGLAGIVNDTTPAHQHARLAQVGEQAARFFPNPRFNLWLRGLDLRAQERERLRQARDTDLYAHVFPRAQGLDAPAEDVWLFTGREAALRSACAWLDNPKPGTLIVTGDPGTGKSALLSRLFVLARQRGRVPNPHLLPADTIPPPGSIHRFIHARGDTPQDLLAALGEACGVDDTSSLNAFLDGVRALETPVTVIVDAVDEAVGAREDRIRLRSPVVQEVLAPLIATAAHSGLRLMIGTRRHLLDGLGRPARVIDLDAPEFADRDSVRRYARACLTELVDDSPYRGRQPSYLDAVAAAIAAKAGGSFLVALITARSLALLDTAVDDPSSPAWRAGLPALAADAMRNDLDRRLGEQAGRARDLLLPLAYAESTGLPWEDLWPALVRQLTGRACANADLDWLVEHAGYYIVESTLDRHSTYRLYHESLAEHLRAGRDAEADQAAIVDTLVHKTPRLPDGTTDWAQAHPYTQTAIATHATGTDRLDQLLVQPRFLLHTAPAPLLTALPHARSADARASADAYQRAATRIKLSPSSEHAAYLQLAARCARAPHIADAIATSGLPLPWSAEWASWRLQPPHHTLTGHDGTVTHVAFGHLDGRPVIVSSGEDDTVRLWDAASGAQMSMTEGRAIAVGQFNDRLLFADQSPGHRTEVRDAASGEPIGLPARYALTAALGLLSHRPVIALATLLRANVVNLIDGDQLIEFTQQTGDISSLCLGVYPSRSILCCGQTNGSVRIYDLVSGLAMEGPGALHSGAVRSLAPGWVNGHPVIASGGDDDAVRLWDPKTGKLVAEPLIGHTEPVVSVAFGYIGERTIIISGSRDDTARVWDAATGRQIGEPLTGHTGAITSVAFGQVEDRPVIITGSHDRTVRLWEMPSRVSVGDPFTGHGGGIAAVAFGHIHDRPAIASGGEDRAVRVWDAVTGTPMGEPLIGHSFIVKAVAISRLDDRPIIISGGEDGFVIVWDAVLSTPIAPPYGTSGRPMSGLAAIQAHGRTLVALADDEGAVWMSDVLAMMKRRSGTGRRPLINRVYGVCAIAFGRVGGRAVLVTGSHNGDVHVWDPDTGASIGGPEVGHVSRVNAVAIGETPTGAVIASVGVDKTVRLWDAVTGVPIGEPLTGHTDFPLSVALGQIEGRTIVASGGHDETIRIWDVLTGEPVGRVITGHVGRVNSIAFGQIHGRPTVVSGGVDSTIRLWDAAKGSPVGDRFIGHTDLVWSVAAAGSLVVSSGRDQTVRRWDAATGTPIVDQFVWRTQSPGPVALGVIRGTRAIAWGGLRKISVWAATTGMPLAERQIPHSGLAVCFGDIDGRTVIVSGGYDGTVVAIDAGSGEDLTAFATQSAVHAVTSGQAEGGSIIVSGHANGRVYTVRMGNGMREWEAHRGLVSSVAFGRYQDREVIVTGGADRAVRLWDALTGERTGERLEHTDAVTGVAIGRIGDRPVIVSGSLDSTVRLWFEDGSRVIRLAAPVRGLCLNGSDQLIVACDPGIVSIRLE